MKPFVRPSERERRAMSLHERLGMSPRERRAMRWPARIAAVGLLLSFAVGVLVPSVAAAEQRPKWEAGIGSVFYAQPDYIGSDDYHFHPIPFPWLIYRGPRLRVDREAVQTKIFGTDFVRLDLSVSGQISVDSKENNRRHDMPNLDWMLQVGPTLKFLVARSDNGRHALDVDVPLRVALAIATDNFSYEGLVASPKLVYRYEPEVWRFEGNAGLEFGSNQYNEYYYSVAQRYETAERPPYEAGGGYAGFRLSGGVSRYFGPIYVGLFARYFNLEGATFRDSPLVGSRSAFIGGVAIGWVWMKSDEMVTVGAEANLAARAPLTEESEPAARSDDPGGTGPVAESGWPNTRIEGEVSSPSVGEVSAPSSREAVSPSNEEAPAPAQEAQ